MPSPTEITWPTSATSVCLSNSAICFLRIAEISAAWMSINVLPLGGAQRAPEFLQLAADRSVDHARADAHDEAADEIGLDLRFDVDLLAHRFLQRLGQLGALLGRERARGRHVDRHLAAPLGEVA